MDSETKAIKAICMGHLRQSIVGRSIYGQHDIHIFDGHLWRLSVLEVRGPSRFCAKGLMIIYHPTYGKWQATLLSAHHCGKPVQVLTAAEIMAALRTQPSEAFIHRVYEGIGTPHRETEGI